MKVAVIGSGGREHTLVWKLAQSPKVEELYVIPGSAAMEDMAICVPIQVSDLNGITDYCKMQHIDMVVVGPEVPLTQGLTDICEQAGIAVFGPNKDAAQLEGSKVFAKNLMKKYHVPTASYASFEQGEDAKEYIRGQGAPIVVKADGLAAGKGVVVASTVKEAVDAVNAIMEDRVFGEAGGKIVIEECMVGEEASLLAFVDGKTIVPMIAAQDHKRIFDKDKGPNTGGMGAYAPAPVLTPELQKEVEQKILNPVVQGLAQEGITYKGCLYAGLMMTAEGPKVVEFNCRFGDPETQAVLPLLDSDLADIMYACAKGKLEPSMVKWKNAFSCCVIMASKGYPASSHRGDIISGLENVEKENVVVFHSGTVKRDAAFQTNGGRVLGVTAVAETLPMAIRKAYENVEHISFPGMQYRKDIGAKGLRHLK